MARLIFLLVLLTGVAECFAARSVNGSLSPIVIVPGILGNQLEARLNKPSSPHFYCDKHHDWYTLWLSVSSLVWPFVQCFSDNAMLHYNETTGEYSNTEGVEIRVPDFGGTSSIEYLDPDTKDIEVTQYFYRMVSFFVDHHGYVRGKTIVGAPFDWRYAPDGYLKQGYYANLKKLIEQVYVNGNNTRVTLIAHSMGAPTSLYFLTKYVDQQWKDTYLKVYVTVSGVWRGAAKALKAMASGDNEGIVIDKDIWGREGQRSEPSTAWLMPFPSDTWPRETILIVTPEANYSAWDYKVLFDAMKYPRGYEMFEEVKNLTSALPPPNVTTYCFYGDKMQTPVQFIYENPGDFPDTDPKSLCGDGDGTVNIDSLTACKRWQGQQHYPVTLRGFDGVEHVHTIKNDDVISAVEQIVLS